jgi:hypothetical protein
LIDTAEDRKDAPDFYEGQVPSFVEAALETLYGSLYASLPQLMLGGLDGVSTYVATHHGELRALFLYVREGSAVRVINEGMTIQVTDAENFATALFARDSRIQKIRFHAVRVTDKFSARPAFRAPVTEDIAITLPKDEASYTASLGKSTRKTLRQNLSRAGNLLHSVVPGEMADAALIDNIIGFNHARMAGKHRKSAIDGCARKQLLALIRKRGMVGTVHVDGLLRAGTLACRIGDDVYSLVNAHDSAVDHLGMGNLSRHLMILAAIRAGARHFHLLGGHFCSKRTSGALRISLDALAIYRSRLAMMADTAGLIGLALQSLNYKLRVAVEDSDRLAEAGLPMRVAGKGILWIRETVHALRRLQKTRH